MTTQIAITCNTALSENAIKPIPTPIKDVTSNIKELRDRVTALEAKTKEPPKTTADEKKKMIWTMITPKNKGSSILVVKC